MTDLLIDLIKRGITIEFSPGMYPGELEFRMRKDDYKVYQRISLIEIERQPAVDILAWGLEKSASILEAEIMRKELDKFTQITEHFGIIFSNADPMIGPYYEIRRVGSLDRVAARRTKEEATKECKYLENLNFPASVSI